MSMPLDASRLRGVPGAGLMLTLLALCLGCDPVYVRRVVARPDPAATRAATASDADPLALVRRVVDRWQMTLGTNQPGYPECYWRGGVNVCARTSGDSIELRVQAWPIHLRTLADSVGRELQDSLSTRYGPSRVVLRKP